MPIPWPRKDENQGEFVRRCMGDPVMAKEYEPEQRAGICYTQWRRYQGVESQKAAQELLTELKAARAVVSGT